MKRITRRASLGATCLAVFALVSACKRSGPSQNRCAFCGMRIPAGSHWMAGAVDANGHTVEFDTPGCLFRYRASSAGRGLREAWITEYYGPAGIRTPVSGVQFVVGSDVIGPMGPDLVPVDPARVDAFRRDHHGRAVYSFDTVTGEVLQSL